MLGRIATAADALALAVLDDVTLAEQEAELVAVTLDVPVADPLSDAVAVFVCVCVWLSVLLAEEVALEE